MDDLIDRALKATVKVKFTSQHDVWTGIVIGETSDFTLVLTVAHSLDSQTIHQAMEVIFSDIEEAFPAVIVLCNRDASIMILKIGKGKENESRRVDFASGDEQHLTYGQKLFGFSHPDQREWSYSRGYIMHPGSKNDTNLFSPEIMFFDHDTRGFSSGSCGAGILNKDGKLVGMQCLICAMTFDVLVMNDETQNASRALIQDNMNSVKLATHVMYLEQVIKDEISRASGMKELDGQLNDLIENYVLFNFK